MSFEAAEVVQVWVNIASSQQQEQTECKKELACEW